MSLLSITQPLLATVSPRRQHAPGGGFEKAEHAAAFVPLPFIEYYWDDTPGRRQPSEINARFRVLVPLLQELTPIVRRRGKSVNAVELEDLIRELSGPERERVRGYVEAIVEQRADAEG